MDFIYTKGKVLGLETIPNHRITLAIDREFRRIGVAACSPKDHFERELGNLIATGRADRRRSSVVYPAFNWEIVAPKDFVHDIKILKLLKVIGYFKLIPKGENHEI
jgi:hypothetical protein